MTTWSLLGSTASRLFWRSSVFPVTVSAFPKRHRPLPAMNITVMYSTSSARTVRAADSLPDATSGHGVVLPDKIPTMYSGKRGDDYTGDPAQEQQGLNSVFATDSTIEIIKAENRKLQN